MRKFPKEDYVDASYDKDLGVKPTDILFLFSTERSGSTFFCSLLQRFFGFVCHEYFHPYHYMPVLANRWGCVGNDGVINTDLYVDSLMKFRTGPSGWLGINLHGSHIKNYMKFEGYFKGVRKHYIHLVRNDIISQAVSFEIAMQTGAWSSHYDVKVDPVYNYANILKQLRNIQAHNALIQAYLMERDCTSKTIIYEDFMERPREYLDGLPCPNRGVDFEAGLGLRKQSTTRNAEWAKQFAHDYLNDKKGEGIWGRSKNRVIRLLGGEVV